MFHPRRVPAKRPNSQTKPLPRVGFLVHIKGCMSAHKTNPEWKLSDERREYRTNPSCQLRSNSEHRSCASCW